MKSSARADSEVKRLREGFTKELPVKVTRSTEGGFVASVLSVPGLEAEADTFSTLIDVTNDAIRAFLRVPYQYRAYMPTYLPPVEAAVELDAYPVREKRSRS